MQYRAIQAAVAIRSDAPITITRQRGEDASAIAAQAARAAGTTLVGNLRWYGASGPAHREIGTADGRTIRVVEPADEVGADWAGGPAGFDGH